MELPASLYVPVDGGYEATALTIGPWDPGFRPEVAEFLTVRGAAMMEAMTKRRNAR